MILTPSKHPVKLKIERNIGENLRYKKCFTGFSLALNRGRFVRAIAHLWH